MKERRLASPLRDALSDTPVVFVQGPRQCGKSTLVRSLDPGAEYRTLDDAAQLSAAMRDPDGYVDGLPERVILDEVQRAPELFRAVKRSVDVRRKPGRFLLTGSAHALVLPRVSESLAGRMEILTLSPFTQGEIEGVKEDFVDVCFGADFKPGKGDGEGWPGLVERMVRGGFPEVLNRRDEARRQAWFAGYITSMLERDVRDLTNVHHLQDLPRLLRLIAARSSGLLNLANLARDAEMPASTLQRHWALLEAVFLVGGLPAWGGSLTARLAKAPKIYVEDSGVLCHLLGLDAERLKNDDLMTGAVLETFVAGELAKQASWSRVRPKLHHFRTHTQKEVDLVLEDARGRLVGIEVKKTASPSKHDLRGLLHFREAVGKRFVRGILLYTGTEPVAFGSDLHAVPVSALWGA
jgi:hypothetical protein